MFLTNDGLAVVVTIAEWKGGVREALTKQGFHWARRAAGDGLWSPNYDRLMGELGTHDLPGGHIRERVLLLNPSMLVYLGSSPDDMKGIVGQETP